MKHLLTAIACSLAVAGSAQTPYNPDSNGNGLIEVEDVLSVLAVYNTPFMTLPYSDEAILVPFSEEEEGFLILDLAPIYIIDCRLDPTNEDGNSATVYFNAADALYNSVAPLNGAEFWFISNNSPSGYIYANVPTDCNEYSSSSGVISYVFYNAVVEGYSETEQSICGDYEHLGQTEVMLSKIIYFNGEFIRMK